MGERPGGETGGLLSALKNIAATLLASGRTRLELLSNEIEEGKLRVIELGMLAGGALFCFAMGIVLIIALLVTLFWEQRLAVLGIFAAVFLAFGSYFLARLKRASHRPDKIFAASIAELEEDLRHLRSMAGHEPPAR